MNISLSLVVLSEASGKTLFDFDDPLEAVVAEIKQYKCRLEVGRDWLSNTKQVQQMWSV